MLRRRKGEASPPLKKSRGAIESEEARLVGLIAAGDLQAFDSLYRRYFPRLLRFLNHMTRCAHLVDEIVNDTMLVVWQKASSYDLSSKVSTWVFVIAYRKTLKAMKYADEPVECDFEQCAGESGHEPENEITLHELQKNLAWALDTLPVDQRAVMNLTCYHGMGYQEIGEIMNCPVNTVKTRMFYARRRLRTLLANRMEKTR